MTTLQTIFVIAELIAIICSLFNYSILQRVQLADVLQHALNIALLGVWIAGYITFIEYMIIGVIGWFVGFAICAAFLCISYRISKTS